MGLFYQLLHILHGTKFLIHLPVIPDIVPVVLLRGIIDRAQPDDVNSQVFQIIQLPDNPLQIPEPVPIGIHKASRINLIYNGLLPPIAHTHISS